MEQIKILFFVIGSFFGVEQSRIVAETTSVTLNPQEKTITVLQENLISLIQNESDSLIVLKELTNISASFFPWSSEFNNYTKKEKRFYVSEDGSTLNLELHLGYVDAKNLKSFGIEINDDGNYIMTNFPNSHVKSEDGVLGERYWTFDSKAPFSFTENPLKDMPENYKKIQKSLVSYWTSIKH